MTKIILTDVAGSSDGSYKLAFHKDNNWGFESIVFEYEDTRFSPPREYRTICISSQAGCPVGCSFCASGHSGFFGNLDEADLEAQVQLAREALRSRNVNDRIDVCVLMGMGEPLLNYEAVSSYSKHARQQFVGMALSTVGIVPKMRALAEDGEIDLTLQVSLHSPFDNERKEIIPLAGKYSIAEIISAAEYYSTLKGKRSKVSYLLLSEFNDDERHAHAFASLLNPSLLEAKLLLYNPAPQGNFRRPELSRALSFSKILESYGIVTVTDVSKGTDVGGGCGQFVKREKVGPYSSQH